VLGCCRAGGTFLRPSSKFALMPGKNIVIKVLPLLN
jgi:hypothetical protein